MSNTDQEHTLHFVTFPKHTEQPPEPCSGGYTCICTPCTQDRDRAVNRGIRPTPSIPVRKAA